MVDIVLPENRALYSNLLNDMYRMRYDVVVKEWGWDVPGIEPGFDKDQFDTDETVYLLCLDEVREKVLGCCRLNPTTSPHMLSELYSEACDLQSVPRSKTILEASRFVVATKRVTSKEQHFDIIWQLGVALNEYCQRVGVTQITWYTSPPFYNTINSVMTTLPLGRPRRNAEDNETYVPAISEIDADGLARLRDRLHDPEERITFALAPLIHLSTPFVQSPRKAA